MPLTVLRRPEWWLRAMTLAVILTPLAARADFHVRSPDDIDTGEWELESNDSVTLDHDPLKGGDNSFTVELGYGVNSWYHTELELDLGRLPAPGEVNRYQGFASENTFRLTQPGEYWADFGLYAEYAHGAQRAIPDAILFGPLIQKDIGHTTETLNLFLTQEIGPNRTVGGPDFSYAWRSRWNVIPQISPAIEIYGDTGGIGHIPGLRDQQLLAGPVLLGEFPLGRFGNLKYQVGYLVGLTQATAAGTIKWGFEWEMRF